MVMKAKQRKLLIWGALAITWFLFFFWYTSFGGPLSEEEVDKYMTRFESGESSPDKIAAFRHFLETDTGDDFVMLNIIEMHEQPERISGVAVDDTSADVLARYMAYMWPALLSRACHPVMFGSAAADAFEVWGIDGEGRWSQAAFMRYRSRRDMLEIAGNPEFQGPHEFKQAAMARTIAFPVDPWASAGDPRLLFGLVLTIVGLLLTGRR